VKLPRKIPRFALGLVFGAVGLGALFLARQKNYRLGRVIATTAGIQIAADVFTVARVFWLSFLVLVGVACG
jgi:hypothetical protein